MNSVPPSQFDTDLPTPFERSIWKHRRRLALASFAFVFILACLLLPHRDSFQPVHFDPNMEKAMALGEALNAYTKDHHEYPQGRTSTEIFQQLLDGHYLRDTSLLYLPMKGKFPATSKMLKPENICWDVTVPVATTDSDVLPLVFSTGYRIEYVTTPKADPLPSSEPTGIAVFYKGGSAGYNTNLPGGIYLGGGIIGGPFDPKGKTYRQLTPDGPLP